MKKKYKLQNTNYKQITNSKSQITNIRGVQQAYLNCQLPIVNYQLSMKPAPQHAIPQHPITPIQSSNSPLFPIFSLYPWPPEAKWI